MFNIRHQLSINVAPLEQRQGIPEAAHTQISDHPVSSIFLFLNILMHPEEKLAFQTWNDKTSLQ